MIFTRKHLKKARGHNVQKVVNIYSHLLQDKPNLVDETLKLFPLGDIAKKIISGARPVAFSGPLILSRKFYACFFIKMGYFNNAHK